MSSNGARISFLLYLVLTLAFIFALNTRFGSIPAIGPFLDPASGVWHNARIPDIPAEPEIKIPGLIAPVTVVFNDRGVPHIFAENEPDLFMAQGYIVAQHRLWQMDFATRAAAGRISEIVGERALEYDRYQRKIGMTYGARNTHDHMMSNEHTKMMLESYAAGVNAYIDGLTKATLPFEFKLLGYEPEPWTTLNTALFTMSMYQTLSGRSSSYGMSRIQAAFGPELTSLLFPDYPSIEEPIISADRKWDFRADLPSAPEERFVPQIIRKEFGLDHVDSGIGSNNWAIHGSRTMSGNPLLASDPHLTLNLPAIWYEIQLNAPGVNTYGVSLPSLPGVVIGFNEKTSWALTNTGGFAMDLFEVVLNSDKSAYLHDGEWKPIRYELETYHTREGNVHIDTLFFTHHGPVAYLESEFPDQADSLRIKTFTQSIPVGQAIQWVAHTPSDPVGAMYRLITMSNFDEFVEAVEMLESLAQNFAYASVDGDIAMKISGRHPVRWQGQGTFISDGTDSRYDWKSFIPYDQVPWEVNPSRGFVSSANQLPAASDYPYFLGNSFASPARASIINNRLHNLVNATYMDMIDLQMNNSNWWAENWLDKKLDLMAEMAGLLNQKEYEALELLNQWNMINEADEIAPVIYEAWASTINLEMFGDKIRELTPPISNVSRLVVFNELFGTNGSPAYRMLHGTDPDASEIVFRSFQRAIRLLEERLESTIGESWQHWRNNGSTINHLLNVQALNLPRLRVGGSSESPNAIRDGHGPSWRMVTEMGSPVRAWGIYPGGQSGNPASKGYTAFVERWAEGRPYELTLFQSADQAVSAIGNRIVLGN